MLFIQLTFLIKRKIFLLANKNYINYGLFFLSKSIGGEAGGAKGCAPHSVQPRMRPSCFCTLPFVCPLCAQSREGGGHRLQGWVRAPVRLPPLRIHGRQGTASVPTWPPVCTSPLHSSQGEGGRGSTRVPGCVLPCAQSGGRVVPPPGLALACPLGAQTGKAPLPFHMPPVRVLPLRRNPGGGAGGGVGLRATGGMPLPIPTQPLICVLPLHANWGRRGARRTASGIGCGPRPPPLCARGGRGGGKGGGLPVPARALFSRPPLSRVPRPVLCATGGTKKGVRGPFPFTRGPPAWFARRPGPQFCAKGVQRGGAHPLPALACTPSPVAPLLCTW